MECYINQGNFWNCIQEAAIGHLQNIAIALALVVLFFLALWALGVFDRQQVR